MDELRTSHPTELFYFQPATKETEVEEDDCEPPDYRALSEEDDILYTEGGEAVVDDATTLLFISPVGAATANTEEVGLKESRYLMELTSRKEICF